VCCARTLDAKEEADVHDDFDDGYLASGDGWVRRAAALRPS
jgi:hypothetical protein